MCNNHYTLVQSCDIVFHSLGVLLWYSFTHCKKKKSVQCTPNMVCYVCPIWNLERLIWREVRCVLRQIGCDFTPTQCAFQLTSVFFPLPLVYFHTNSVCFPTKFSIFPLPLVYFHTNSVCYPTNYGCSSQCVSPY